MRSIRKIVLCPPSHTIFHHLPQPGSNIYKSGEEADGKTSKNQRAITFFPTRMSVLLFFFLCVPDFIIALIKLWVLHLGKKKKKVLRVLGTIHSVTQSFNTLILFLSG